MYFLNQKFLFVADNRWHEESFSTLLPSFQQEGSRAGQCIFGKQTEDCMDRKEI
jgi:hypothetical protein